MRLRSRLIKLRDFRVQDFQRYHPGGHLGERLQVPLYEVMRQGLDIPKVPLETRVSEALEEMSQKDLGATLIVGPEDELLGIFTDGDLRRTLNQFPDLGSRFIQEVMTPAPRAICADRSVAEALEMMEQHLITVLPVVDTSDRLQGILHLHDLLGKGKIRFARNHSGQ